MKEKYFKIVTEDIVKKTYSYTGVCGLKQKNIMFPFFMLSYNYDMIMKDHIRLPVNVISSFSEYVCGKYGVPYDESRDLFDDYIEFLIGNPHLIREGRYNSLHFLT